MQKKHAVLLVSMALPACGEIVNAPSRTGVGLVSALHLHPSGDELPVRVGGAIDLKAIVERTCFDRMDYAFNGGSGKVEVTDIRCEPAGRCSIVQDVVTQDGARALTLRLDQVQSVTARVTGTTPGTASILVHVSRAAEAGDRPEPSTCGYSFDAVVVRVLP